MIYCNVANHNWYLENVVSMTAIAIGSRTKVDFRNLLYFSNNVQQLKQNGCLVIIIYNNTTIITDTILIINVKLELLPSSLSIVVDVVGLFVGLFVGFIVGLFVRFVGSFVGLSVGLFVGSFVGLFVGDKLVYFVQS